MSLTVAPANSHTLDQWHKQQTGSVGTIVVKQLKLVNSSLIMHKEVKMYNCHEKRHCTIQTLCILLVLVCAVPQC